MLRAALTGMAMLGLLTTAFAQSKINCGEAHRSFLAKLERGDFGRLSAEQLAAHKRKAQRVYNACVTGDVEDPKSLFERLDANRY
jgi:hypothetical protein